MKKVIVILCLLLIPALGYADQRVRGYYRDSNGDGLKDQYVNPYNRTSPNSIRTDNYNYPGNYNPNAGRMTPQSSSPSQNYPYNPNPYQKRKSNW